MHITLPKSLHSLSAEVLEVISDTELRLKAEFGKDDGKSTEFIRENMEGGIEFKKVPFIDQQEMYRHVYQCLKQGGAIGIFPEGQSVFLSSV